MDDEDTTHGEAKSLTRQVLNLLQHVTDSPYKQHGINIIKIAQSHIHSGSDRSETRDFGYWSPASSCLAGSCCQIPDMPEQLHV